MSGKTNLMSWLITLLLLVVLVESAFADQIIYVDTDAPGPTHDGSCWADAFICLQDALTPATPTNSEIRVAQGTYKPDEGDGITPGELTWELMAVQPKQANHILAGRSAQR